MTITRIDNSKPGAPTDLTEEAASKPVAPSNLTEQAESKPVAPANLTEQAKNDPAAPVTLTGVAASEPLAPLNLSELSKVDPAAPANLTEIAKSEPLAPTNLSELALSNPVAPVNLTEIARPGINRTLSPLFNFNAALGLPESVTYSRSSSASYVETYTDEKGRIAKRIVSNFIGSFTNLILYSESFDNAYWGKTATSVLKINDKSPVGSDVFKLFNNTESNVHILASGTVSVSIGVQVTSSIYVKKGSLNKVAIYDAQSVKGVLFNLDTQRVLQTIGSVDEYSIDYVSDGWYLISMTITTTATTARISVYLDSFSSYVGNGDFIFVSGAQLTQTAKRVGYIKTIDSSNSKLFEAEPRYEEKGLLIEAVSSNLILNSENITTVGGWTADDVVLTGKTLFAPDGTLTATRMADTAVADLHRTFQSIVTSSGIVITLSFYVKAGTSSKVAMQSGINGATSTGVTIFDTATGLFVTSQLGDQAEYVGDGWWRVSKNYTTISTAVTPQILMVDQATNNISYIGSGNFIYIWGAQCEALPFATSYIRTVSAVATRAAETIISDLPDLNVGTLFVEFETLGANSANQTPIALEGLIGTNYIWVLSTPAGAQSLIRTYIQLGATIQTSYISTIDTVDNVNKVAFVFAYDNARTYINDLLLNTDNVSVIPTINRLSLGAAGSGGNPLYGHITRAEVYDLALTANEVKAL